MRLILRSFVVLDIVSLVFLSMQLWHIVTHLETFKNESLAEQINAGLMFPMFWLILIGTYGLFFQKKFGYILYYIQFPFRLFLWIFSLGFITLLPEALSYYGDSWFDPLLKICFMAELIRLYITVRANMNKGIV